MNARSAVFSSILAAVLSLALPVLAHAGASGSSEAISKWILHSEPSEHMGEPIPGKTEFHTFLVKGGVLTFISESYSDDNALRPSKETYTVPLAKVARFLKGENQSKGRTLQDIGIETKGDQDITYVFGSGLGGKHGGFPGLAQFGPEQAALRDAVYSKLCALIGQAP